MIYSFTLRHLANEALPFIQKAYAEQEREIEDKEKTAALFQRQFDNAETPQQRDDILVALSLEKESIATDKAGLRQLSHICTALEQLEYKINDGKIDNSVLISADDLADSP